MRYNKEYRLRALEYWAEGHTKNEAAEVFKVDLATLYRWRMLLKESGSVEAKTHARSWSKVDPARLLQFLEDRPDAYLKEIAEEFSCSDTAIFYAMRRLKISRKKNHGIQRGE